MRVGGWGGGGGRAAQRTAALGFEATDEREGGVKWWAEDRSGEIACVGYDTLLQYACPNACSVTFTAATN